MNTGLIARASVTIAAPAADVWEALVTPAAIKTYMFGATVTSDWVVGSPIVWTDERQGQAYQDKGIILEIVRERVLRIRTTISPTRRASARKGTGARCSPA
jgi:uncharacterized protein YndB with AHSA1/START domain